MRKSKPNRPKRSSKKGAGSSAHIDTNAADAATPSRRRFIGISRTGAIAAAFVGGGGYLIVNNVMGSVHEQDLSRVDNGKPTIVQIHDPQCSMCRSLQAETRQALKHFDEDQIDYVVANIKTPLGKSFADRFGVPHVTLLLFDAEGKLVQTLQGQRNRGELRNRFSRMVSG